MPERQPGPLDGDDAPAPREPLDELEARARTKAETQQPPGETGVQIGAEEHQGLMQRSMVERHKVRLA